MGNGMYCDIPAYREELTAEQQLYLSSRKTLEYLKAAHSRMMLLMKQLSFYKRNPLCGAMCKEVETKIYQQSLLLKRHHQQLNDMIEKYNRMSGKTDGESTPLSQHSSQSDWEEVMEMAKRPVESMCARPLSISSTAASADTVFKSIYQSPASSTATSAESIAPPARGSQKTFPMQMTPPLEEVVELREHLRVLEKSPLFTAMPATIKQNPVPMATAVAMLSTGQRSPNSLP
ncbi:hypothetical protein GGI07_002236 [Coemansia sp. Benny D115]|nr:hypothetical protein GGI07_002236 [Coemansia sp. Benny D115]